MSPSGLQPVASLPPPIPAGAGLRRWLILAAVAMGVFLSAWLLRASEPRGQAFFPKCQFHELTGMQCPGCGSTRAMHHLLNGRIVDALRSNAMLVGFLPVAAVVVVGGFRRWWRGGEFLPFIGGRLVWWGVGLMLAFFFVRNIPARPFIYLNPPVAVPMATTSNP